MHKPRHLIFSSLFLFIPGLLLACLSTKTITTATLISPTQSSSSLTLTVKARIDGLSRLIIQGDTAHWFHLVASAPGRWIPAPTIFNNVEWNPDWPDAPDRGNQSCLCASSSFQGLPSITDHPPLTLEVIQARGLVAILQQPSLSNDFSLIVEFDDLTPLDTYGDDWYEIKLIAAP